MGCWRLAWQLQMSATCRQLCNPQFILPLVFLPSCRPRAPVSCRAALGGHSPPQDQQVHLQARFPRPALPP